MAIFTIREKMIFLADVADNLLNERGRLKFLAYFYWQLDPGGNMTRSMLGRAEKRLAELIQKSEYRK